MNHYDDLYDILECNRGSSRDEIRKAYRRKARKAHPDGGGSVERFGQLKLAHDTLTDDERRERYDRTGKAEESGPDDRVSAGMQMAVGAVDSVLSAMDKAGTPVWKADVIGLACEQVEGQIQQVKNHIAKGVSSIEKVEKMAKRFKVKKGRQPFLRQAMDAKVASIRDDIRVSRMHVDRLEVALGLLKDHDYDMTPEKSDTPFADIPLSPWWS